MEVGRVTFKKGTKSGKWWGEVRGVRGDDGYSTIYHHNALDLIKRKYPDVDFRKVEVVILPVEKTSDSPSII